MVTEEQREIQALARDFAEGALRPHAGAWDAARSLDDGVFAQLAELGFLGMLVPEAYGGLDFDVVTYLLVLEELARGDAAVALPVSIHNGAVVGLLLARGSGEQKSLWLPRLAAGEALGAFALSEPDAGSDPAGLTTTAERTDDGWLLRGTKRWVTSGARAGLVVVFARTGPEGIGAFLVEPSAPGYRVTGHERTLGLRASETVSVELDGVVIGEDALVGDPGDGLNYALQALDAGRIGVAAQAVGIARAAFEHAAGYALDRRQFGHALADFGATQMKLGEMQRRIAAARALAHEAGRALQEVRSGGLGDQVRRGPEGVIALAAAAKLTASESATWVADEAVQIFGGYGYMRDYPVEKLLRDAKGTEIFQGTNEIMRDVIAREALRPAREARAD